MKLKYSNIISIFFSLIAVQVILNTSNCFAQTDSTDTFTQKAWTYTKKQIKIKGGINASTIFYDIQGAQARRDPFYWIISGNLSINIGQHLYLPFSATFSKQNSNYTRPQPFNQFGLSPKYKFLTFHLGYRNINLSEFTLAGNIFLGGGVEINHKEFPIKLIVLGGRFAKAYNRKDTNNLLGNYPSYERWGFGTKLWFEKDNKSLAFILFKATDNNSSVPDSLASALGLKPAENLVLGTTAKYPILKNLVFNGEYAVSSFNPDNRLPEKRLDDYTYANNFGSLFTPRANTQFNSAFTGNLELTLKIARLTASYRRIGPDYKTLGSTFLNNDFEDFTGGVSWQMYKKKISISVNGGVQRNNIGGQQLSTLLRIIGSGNITFAVNEKLNLNGNYANYNSSTQLTQFVYNSTNDARPDSLKYLQVTNSAGLGINYALGKGNVKKIIFSNINFQAANDNRSTNTQFYNVNTGLSTKIPAYKLDMNFSYNYASNNTKTIKIENTGPVISASRPIINSKVKLTLTSSFMNTLTNGNLSGLIFNNRMAYSYVFLKKHNFTLDCVYLIRSTKQGSGKSFTELRVGLNYGWSF